MATKPKAKASARKRGASTPLDTEHCSDEKNTTKARNILNPTIRGAVTAQAFSKAHGDTDLQSLVTELGNQVGKVTSNDLLRAESLLITQAHTLDGIFNELARRAAMNMGEYIKATDTYLRLALKAQSQCRATLETLAAIKNPPIVYARQANIANGPQQINNGVSGQVRAGAHAHGDIPIQPNELSGGGNELLPDARASGFTIPANQEVEALGEIHRAEIRRG